MSLNLKTHITNLEHTQFINLNSQSEDENEIELSITKAKGYCLNLGKELSNIQGEQFFQKVNRGIENILSKVSIMRGMKCTYKEIRSVVESLLKNLVESSDKFVNEYKQYEKNKEFIKQKFIDIDTKTQTTDLVFKKLVRPPKEQKSKTLTERMEENPFLFLERSAILLTMDTVKVIAKPIKVMDEIIKESVDLTKRLTNKVCQQNSTTQEFCKVTGNLTNKVSSIVVKTGKGVLNELKPYVKPFKKFIQESDIIDEACSRYKVYERFNEEYYSISQERTREYLKDSALICSLIIPIPFKQISSLFKKVVPSFGKEVVAKKIWIHDLASENTAQYYFFSESNGKRKSFSELIKDVGSSSNKNERDIALNRFKEACFYFGKAEGEFKSRGLLDPYLTASVIEKMKENEVGLIVKDFVDKVIYISQFQRNGRYKMQPIKKIDRLEYITEAFAVAPGKISYAHKKIDFNKISFSEKHSKKIGFHDPKFVDAIPYKLVSEECYEILKQLEANCASHGFKNEEIIHAIKTFSKGHFETYPVISLSTMRFYDIYSSIDIISYALQEKNILFANYHINQLNRKIDRYGF
jgi:hypothetical protein